MAAKHAAGESQQNASHTLVAPDGPQLEEVLRLMAEGKVKLEVAKVCALTGLHGWRSQTKSRHTSVCVCLCARFCFLLPLSASVQTHAACCAHAVPGSR
jgi:hypothetical protein